MLLALPSKDVQKGRINRNAAPRYPNNESLCFAARIRSDLSSSAEIAAVTRALGILSDSIRKGVLEYLRPQSIESPSSPQFPLPLVIYPSLSTTSSGPPGAKGHISRFLPLMQEARTSRFSEIELSWSDHLDCLSQRNELRAETVSSCSTHDVVQDVRFLSRAHAELVCHRRDVKVNRSY